jgi:hypothetical protein
MASQLRMLVEHMIPGEALEPDEASVRVASFGQRPD